MSAIYPILFGQTEEYYEARRNGTEYPYGVPWDLVKDHEKQAFINHSQTLTHLAGRGGLSPKELWCVVNDIKYYNAHITGAEALEWLKSIDGVVWKKA